MSDFILIAVKTFFSSAGNFVVCNKEESDSWVVNTVLIVAVLQIFESFCEKLVLVSREVLKTIFFWSFLCPEMVFLRIIRRKIALQEIRLNYHS